MMNDFLPCDMCGKPANLYLTQIVEGKVLKTHLCKDCAQQQGFAMLHEWIAQQLMLSKERHLKKTHSTPHFCIHCGYDLNQTKKNKQLGCPLCYQQLPNIKKLLEQAHPQPTYKGKQPPKLIARQNLHQKMLSIEGKMHMAVSEERYEDAAQFRDELKDLQIALLTKNPS